MKFAKFPNLQALDITDQINGSDITKRDIHVLLICSSIHFILISLNYSIDDCNTFA